MPVSIADLGNLTDADFVNPTEPVFVFCEKIGRLVEVFKNDFDDSKHYPEREFQLVDFGHQTPHGALSLGFLLMPPPSAPNRPGSTHPA